MRSSEWVALVYFAVLVAAAWIRPLPLARRLSITAVGLAMCAALAWLSINGTRVERDWAPVAIILFGIGSAPVYFLITIAAVWPIVLNTAAGVRAAEPQWLDAARWHRQRYHA